MSGAQAPSGARAPRAREDALYPIRPDDLGEQAAPDEGEHPAEEARAARPARDPGAPTQAERDAHAATHLLVCSLWVVLT
jgi:hypothetical protein